MAPKNELPLKSDYYKLAAAQVKECLKALSHVHHERTDLPEWLIESRVKPDGSIAEKIQRKSKSKPGYGASSLTDLAGVRVVVERLACARSVAGYFLNGGPFSVRQDDSEDFLETPRQDGYRGIHLILEVPIVLDKKELVPVELQVRTLLQHQWSVLSRSEFYKALVEIPPDLLARMRSLSEILHCAEIESEHLLRNRILDECHGVLWKILRNNVLEELYESSPESAQRTGRMAIGLLETDRQLRRALVSQNTQQWEALKAMQSLIGQSSSDEQIEEELQKIYKRVSQFLDCSPVP